VARRYGISSGPLYTWRRYLLEGSLGVTRQPVAEFARVEVMAIPTDPSPAILPAARPAAVPSGPMNDPDGMIEIALPGGVSVRVGALQGRQSGTPQEGGCGNLSQSAILSDARSASRSTTRRRSKSTTIVPNFVPFRQAHSSTPAIRIADRLTVAWHVA
jgi:hypothetical protein